MASPHLAPIVSLLPSVAVGIVATGLLAFVAAKRIGGRSRAKRQLVFLLVSAVCFLGIMGYVYFRLHRS